MVIVTPFLFLIIHFSSKIKPTKMRWLPCCHFFCALLVLESFRLVFMPLISRTFKSLVCLFRSREIEFAISFSRFLFREVFLPLHLSAFYELSYLFFHWHDFRIFVFCFPFIYSCCRKCYLKSEWQLLFVFIVLLCSFWKILPLGIWLYNDRYFYFALPFGLLYCAIA